MKSRNSMRRRACTAGRDSAGEHVERGKQGRGAVALVVVTATAERSPVAQLEIALARSSAWMCGFSSTASTMATCGGRDRAPRSRRPWRRSPYHRSGTTTCAPPGRSFAHARSATSTYLGDRLTNSVGIGEDSIIVSLSRLHHRAAPQDCRLPDHGYGSTCGAAKSR